MGVFEDEREVKMRLWSITKSVVVVICAAAFLFCGGNIHAAASDTPMSEIYFYDHGDVGLDALDTTQFMSQTESEIDSAGYACYSYENILAGPITDASVIRTLADDAVFIISAHGGPGRVVCIQGSIITRLCADAQADDSCYSLEYNFEGTVNELDDIKIAYWMGCNTYGTSNYGSLNDMCTSLGVDCVITHNQKVYTPYSSYFLYRFAAEGDNGYGAYNSVYRAKASTFSYYGISPTNTTTNCYSTVSSYVFSGEATNYYQVSMEPAGYGA